MAPSKSNMSPMEGGKGEGEEQGVLGLTSSLAHLTLHPGTPKDVATLGERLAVVTLDDTQEVDRKQEEKEEQDEEVEEEEEGEEEEKEEESEAEEEEEEEEKAIDVTKEKEEETKIIEENKEEDKKEDEKEKKEEEEEEEHDIEGRVKKEDTKIKKEEQEEKKEEEESDEDNTAEKVPEPKPLKLNQTLRSRGLQQGAGHSYPSSQHVEYHGIQQQHVQMQQSPMSYVGMSSPEYGQVAGYAGASPTHSATGDMWYSGGQLDTDCTTTSLFPSLAEGSPASICSSNDADALQAQWGSGGCSVYGQDTASPQRLYQDNTPSSLYLTPQYQESPYLLNQDSPQHQPMYQPFPSYQYHPSPPYFSDSSLPQGANSPCYQAGYQEGAFQDSFPGSASPPIVHPTPITPPISPPEPPSGEGKRDVEDILRAVTTVMGDDEPRFPQDESRIIEIKRSLMDIGQLGNLREQLDQDTYMKYYRTCARLRDEELVEGDEDGDNKIILAASQGQEQNGYNERLVALTERVEKINLCCGSVVDWHVNKCRHCGNTDHNRFYSPLSSMNIHGEMVLSNVVIMCYPQPVVQYLTTKVMQRHTDFVRTFSHHCELFLNNQELYPCLVEPLNKLRNLQAAQRAQYNTAQAPGTLPGNGNTGLA